MTRIAFMGGGNMATAIIQGLVKSGYAEDDMIVIEPVPEQRMRLQEQFRIKVLEAPAAEMADADVVLWAVKPQSFAQAAQSAQVYTGQSLQISIMAGVSAIAVAAATRASEVIRAMPNTPALIQKGVTGLYTPLQVNQTQRDIAQSLLLCVGQVIWFDRESDLDIVTAISGSGPAYIYYFIEAMMNAAESLGLSHEQARVLTLGTFNGASALAFASDESPALLREKVTSKGGTTDAALQVLRQHHVAQCIKTAIQSAHHRAIELGISAAESLPTTSV
jgi:pyrroline-5-carboxylate reductase